MTDEKVDSVCEESCSMWSYKRKTVPISFPKPQSTILVSLQNRSTHFADVHLKTILRAVPSEKPSELSVIVCRNKEKNGNVKREWL